MKGHPSKKYGAHATPCSARYAPEESLACWYDHGVYMVPTGCKCGYHNL